MATKKTKASKASKVKPVDLKISPSSHHKPSPAGTKMPPPRLVSGSVDHAVVHRTTAEINVSEKHSLELAKTVMTATISTIASLRDIFPRHRFAIRTYDCADPEVTYESFMNGTSGQFTFERSEDTLNWKILQRGSDGHNVAVNKLLDWIEIAAMDALQRQYLAKLQLSFHSIDDNNVSDLNVIEAYTISFTYENGLMHVGTAEKKNGTANSVVLRGAKKDLYTLVNDVACMIQERDALPGSRRMKMALLYNDTCPQDYNPPGFHADNDPKSLIASNKGAMMGSMNTGHHGISVNLFQQDLCYSQTHRLSSKQTRARLRSPSLSSEIDGGGTQEHGLKLLQSMGKYRGPLSQDTQPVNDTAHQISTREETNAISQATPVFLPYTQDVIDRIDDMRRQKVGSPGQQGNDDLGALHAPDRLAACECGSIIEENDLSQEIVIQCNLCGNFKHVHCYGHLGKMSSASKFACYSCLFDLEELLLPMKLTCVKRRALFYLRQHRFLNSVEELGQHLKLNDKITEEVIGQLAFDGYVEKTTNSQKGRKGKGDPTKPLYHYVADDQRLLGGLFRPELDMGYYLALPTSLSSGNSESPEPSQENSRADRETGIMSFVEKSSRPRDVRGRTTFCQTTLADASSTEGTPSPNFAIARRLRISQSQSLAYDARTSSLGRAVNGSMGKSLSNRKRPHDYTPDREILQSDYIQQGTVRTGLDQKVGKRTKISIVNSPWTFRSSGL